MAVDKLEIYAKELLEEFKSKIDEKLLNKIQTADQSTLEDINSQRKQIGQLKEALKKISSQKAKDLMSIADVLIKKSVWMLGGDGWAYDIGFGGLDHVVASGINVNMLILDTEVYSNTGGQASKATPRGAVAKFAEQGKSQAKKDLGMMLQCYGNVYVAQVAIGDNDAQCIKAFLEAEAYNGPSVIIAYSHCINHGIDMSKGLNQQKLAVDSGHWILYRFNPELIKEGKNPLQLDSGKPKIPITEYMYSENRYRVLSQIDPERAKQLAVLAREDVQKRWNVYEQMASLDYNKK